MVSLPGPALAAQTLSIKSREERVKKMGVMSSPVHSPGDHVEESLPLPREVIAERMVIDSAIFSFAFIFIRVYTKYCSVDLIIHIETTTTATIVGNKQIILINIYRPPSLSMATCF